MIAPGVQILDIDAEQMAFLVAALSGRTSGQKREGARGHLLLLTEEGEVVKAYHSVRGPLENFKDLGPKHLPEMGRRAGVAQITRLERGALERFWERFQRGVDFEGDFLSQLFAAIRAIQPEIGKTLRGWPDSYRNLKLLSEPVARFGVRRIPTAGPLVLAAFDLEAERVSFSSISRFERLEGRDPEITLWTTTDLLFADTPAFHDLKGAAALLEERVRERYGEPAVGTYFTSASFEELVRSKKPATALLELEHRGEVLLRNWPYVLRLVLLLARFVGM